jgi:ketosteroid isomerase-like protein
VQVKWSRRADVKILGPSVACATTVSTVNVDAVAFSEQWVAAWNAHDVELVLEHFHNDVVFTSPVAAKILPDTTGIVRGKPALRDYWTRALQQIPDLRFVVEDVYQGVDTIAIGYRNQADARVCEVLRFNGDVVIEGHGTYLVAP